MKPNITSVEVHPELSHNGHPVDGEVVGAGSLWPAAYTVPVGAWAHRGCMLSRLTGCIKLLFLKLFVTTFGVGYWQGQKFGDTR